MPNVPAICENINCGTIFKSPFLISATNITLINMGCGPCPKCESNGKIPDGRYDAIGDKLFASLRNISDALIIKKSLDIIKKGFQANEEPEKIKQSILKETPEFNSLWDLIPTTKNDAYAFLALIISILTLLVTCYGQLKTDNPQVSIIKQKIINQSFEIFYSQNTQLFSGNQLENHKETKDTQQQ